MSRTTVPLSDSACRSAKPTDRAYKLFDGDGRYLLVQPNGRKGWRLRYVKPDGREELTSFGSYPVVGLADARNKRLEVKRMLAKGIDPIDQTPSQDAGRNQRPNIRKRRTGLAQSGVCLNCRSGSTPIKAGHLHI